jgi:hypothetical protein
MLHCSSLFVSHLSLCCIVLLCLSHICHYVALFSSVCPTSVTILHCSCLLVPHLSLCCNVLLCLFHICHYMLHCYSLFVLHLSLQYVALFFSVCLTSVTMLHCSSLFVPHLSLCYIVALCLSNNCHYVALFSSICPTSVSMCLYSTCVFCMMTGVSSLPVFSIGKF